MSIPLSIHGAYIRLDVGLFSNGLAVLARTHRLFQPYNIIKFIKKGRNIWTIWNNSLLPRRTQLSNQTLPLWRRKMRNDVGPARKSKKKKGNGMSLTYDIIWIMWHIASTSNQPDTKLNQHTIYRPIARWRAEENCNSDVTMLRVQSEKRWFHSQLQDDSLYKWWLILSFINIKNILYISPWVVVGKGFREVIEYTALSPNDCAEEEKRTL